MANLPNLNLNNGTPTIADAQKLQKQLIEKQFNSTQVIPDKMYEYVECSMGYALDWYIRKRAEMLTPLTNEELFRLSELASHLDLVEGGKKGVEKVKFYIDYNFDYNDANVLPDINANNKPYVGQTYLSDDLVTFKRRLVVYQPITYVGQDIESSIVATYTNDTILTFQSFRVVGLDSHQWGDIITTLIATYLSEFTGLDLLTFTYGEVDSNWMTDQLKVSKGLLTFLRTL
jgi:hypothetical protein